MGYNMKKFTFKKLTFCFTIFLAGLLSILGISNLMQNIKAEESVPSYFSVKEIAGDSLVDTIQNNGVALISSNNQKVIAELKGNETITIVHVSPTITFNDTAYSNTDLQNLGIAVNYLTDSFTITSSFTDGHSPYGKYNLTINYIVSINGEQTTKSFNYTYYVLRHNDYFASTSISSQSIQSANTSIENASLSLNSATGYDRLYLYNYQNYSANFISANAYLPTLTFNKTKIRITISKTFQNSTFLQSIYYDGTKLISSGNLVYIEEIANSENVKLVFNDLGTYTIKYNFIYSYNNKIDEISITSLIKKTDMIDIFGYQLYYSDVESSQAKEFKNISSNGQIQLEKTDVSYLFGKDLETAIDSSKNKMSAVIEELNNQIDAGTYELQKTNQAPVQFKYNVEIYNSDNNTESSTQSKVWKLKYENNALKLLDIDSYGSQYDNSPISDTGIYLIQLVYKFYPTIADCDSKIYNNGEVITPTSSTVAIPNTTINAQRLYSQFFIFEITKDTPQTSIVYESDSDNKVIVNDGAFSNQNIEIGKLDASVSMFNAGTKLVVYEQKNYAGSFDEIQTISSNSKFLATENGNYIVTMYFGKNLARSYSSTFTIDKTAIENVQIFASEKLDSSSYYQRVQQIDFWTNQAVALSWNEKQSGSQITAKYKYIPLVKDLNYQFSNTTLKRYYSSLAVPTNYYFDYNKENLVSVAYQNTQSSTYISSQNVLTQAGMYIFCISDSAGNEKYTAFVIDNTSVNFLQKIDNNFVETDELNIISSDATICWGKYKTIEFKNLTYLNGNFTDMDAWLISILDPNKTDIFKNYFDILSINTQNTFLTFSEINQNVLVYNSILNTTTFYTGTEANNYSYDISYVGTDSLALESEYNFYAMDEVNTKVLAGYDKLSQENYFKNYSGNFIVRVSSDSSRTELYYTKNNEKIMLKQDTYSPAPSIDENSNTVKSKYYVPTTIRTLSDSNETLMMTFNPVPNEGVIEIDSIVYTFTPFKETKKTNDGKTAYTYSFDTNNLVKQTIYSRKNPNENLSFNREGANYIWEINKEFNSLTNSYQSRAGKYTITRTYANLTGTQTAISDSLDYMVRTLTFIIDRNGIITSPVVVDELGSTYNYVGESIKLQVLELESAKYFKDIFIASNTTSNSVILSTNKLPVFVYVPVVKYGYSYFDGGNFTTENSVNNYIQENIASKISSYSLSAQIKYSVELSSIDSTKEIYNGSAENSGNGYLAFNNTTSKIAFNKVGYYKVIIYQGDASYTQNQFSFVFQIKQEEPSFKITNQNGEELNPSTDGNYYTNQNKLRLYWTDSSNEFMSVIDKNEISYTVNNTQTYKIDPNNIQTSGKTHTVDIDLKDVNAYLDGMNISVNMQFEGKEKDYGVGYFKTSRNVIVDTVAPTSNINKLVSISEISPSLLRNIETKYNTSVGTGIYKYYAFPIDISAFTQIMDITKHETDGETYQMFYRVFETTSNGSTVLTKYNDIYPQESSTTSIENSTNSFYQIETTSLNSLYSQASKYIEIVEMDLAGNITIYTIYLTNNENAVLSQANAIKYESNTELKTLKYSDLASSKDIFAKSKLQITNVNMYDFGWNKITINDVSYLKTPYSNGKYYNLSTYELSNPTKSLIALEDFCVLNSKAQKQTIQLSLVPYYNTLSLNASVLNTSLSLIHTSATTQYVKNEGILIRIPSSTSDSDAIIYATSVEISQYIKNTNGTYTPTRVYYNNDPTYFKTASNSLVNNSIISSAYVNYLGTTYIKIVISNPIANRFYEYKVVDNFGESYSITNIYGSESIDKEMYSSVNIVENYENGNLSYYSTKDVYFKFNSEKDKIFLTVKTTYSQIGFNLSSAEQQKAFNNSGYGKIITPTKGVVYTIVMYAGEQSMSNGVVGSERNFNLKVYKAIDTISADGNYYKSLNFLIYNIIPHFTLLGIENDDQNELFNKGTIYGNEIKITFKQNVGRIACLVFLEYEDGTIEQISSGKTVSTPNTYTIIIKYTAIFTKPEYNTLLDFIISDNDEDFYNVVYTKDGKQYYAEATGNSFTYKEGTQSNSISSHYILNTSEFEIIYNTAQGVQEATPTTVVINGYTTYIYRLTNVYPGANATRYFTRTIAITVIPETQSILTNFSHYTNEGTLESLTGTLASFVVSTEENSQSTKRLAWTSYYGIPENKVIVKVYYGDSQSSYTPSITTKNNISTITLSTSGTYYLTFVDMAGNIHSFDNSTNSTYEVRYLRSVIFTVNGESPINNAVYDSDVSISIPSSTIKYYNSNAQPKIHVERNGNEYSVSVDKDNKTYAFNEAGLYKVWFSAGITVSNVVTAINEEPIYFLIIRPNETRWAFEYSEYADYFVKQIIRNDIDITESLSNENMGSLTEQTITDENGKTTTKNYLKNFLISIYDSQTGIGKYTITMATNNEFQQEFTFSFWLNNAIPPIAVSQEENTSTTKPIVITFNTKNILDSVGDCVLKITGSENIFLSNANLTDGKIQSSYTITLNSANTYYIQLFSESGKLIYSYRVIKAEPLNAVSIIVIVAVSIITIGLTIMFVLLRKKMQIR